MKVIDAERLKEGLEYHYQPTDQEYEEDRRWAVGYNAGLDRALYSLAYAPALTLDDLRPKGRWVDGECANCGCDALYNKGVPAPTYTEFCPSCGADMRGGGEDA